jgi:hypothetical protein
MAVIGEVWTKSIATRNAVLFTHITASMQRSSEKLTENVASYIEPDPEEATSSAASTRAARNTRQTVFSELSTASLLDGTCDAKVVDNNIYAMQNQVK